MTYSAGGLIQATDYNGFASTTTNGNVNAIWGAGVGSYGYGQSTTLSTVSAAGTVTATQWADLVNRISSIGSHTGVTITSRTAPVAGNTIAILNNLSTDLTNLYTSRANASSSGSTIAPATGTWWQATNTPNAAWTITTTHTISFANAAAARYFFNSGGLIKWESAKTSTGTEADTEWNDLASTLDGAIYLSGANTAHTIAGTAYTGTTKVGGTGTPTTLNTTVGFYNLTTSAATLYDQYADSSPYTSDHIRLQAAVNDNTNPSVITYTTAWINAQDATPGSTSVITGGAAGSGPTTVVSYVAPETTYIANTWGAITISATTSVA
jgi:hypothetical protein